MSSTTPSAIDTEDHRLPYGRTACSRRSIRRRELWSSPSRIRPTRSCSLYSELGRRGSCPLQRRQHLHPGPAARHGCVRRDVAGRPDHRQCSQRGLPGGAGDDVIIGGGGDDIYRFARGDGHDRIEQWLNRRQGTLVFAAGIALEDVVDPRSRRQYCPVDQWRSDDRVTPSILPATPIRSSPRSSSSDGRSLTYRALAASLAPTDRDDRHRSR